MEDDDITWIPQGKAKMLDQSEGENPEDEKFAELQTHLSKQIQSATESIK
jgi:hypothetical protein